MLVNHTGYRITAAFERLVKYIRWALPEGRSLPDDVWQSRHGGIRALLWLHAIGVVCFGLIVGARLEHSLAEGAVLAAMAVTASWHNTPRRFRSSMASLGLITASAVLVHLSGGYIEMHFHFFVMLAVIVLYQDWLPFLLAIGYVIIHHGVVGVLDPTSVYNHPDAFAHPWKWAAIHGTFVLAACVAGIVSWRLNEALRAHNELILNSTGEGIIGLDLQDRITFMNPAAARMVGYEVAELKGRPLHSILRHSKADGVPDPEHEYRIHAPTQEGVVQPVIEGVFWRKDGASFLVDYVSTAIREGGVVVGAVVTFRDITERKQAQMALQKAKDELEIRVADRTSELKDANERLHLELAERQRAEADLTDSEARYKAIATTMPGAIYQFTSRNGIWLVDYVAPQTLELFGLNPEDIMQDLNNFIKHIYPDDLPSFVASVTEAVEKLTPWNFEGRLINPRTGDLTWWQGMSTPVATTSGEIIFNGILLNITARKRAEEALRQSEQRFRQVVSSISDHIYVTEVIKEEHMNLYLSPHVEPLTGYPLAKFIADWSFWPSTVIHPDDRADAAAQAARLAKGQSSQVEYRLVRADGQVIWVRDSGRVEKDTARQSLIVYGVVNDITERKQVEEALRNAHHELERRVQERTAELAQANQDLQAEIAERKWAEAEILQRSREAEALRQAGAALSSTLNYEEVLDRILEQVSQVVPHDASDIMLIKGDTARIFRWCGYERFRGKDFVPFISFRIADTITLRTMRETGRPLAIPYVEGYDKWVYQPETAWIKSYAGTPILIRDQVIGFLNVDSATPGFFSQADAERLQTFAYHTASAIENAQLFAETQRQLFQQTLLYECTQDLILSHDIQAAIAVVTQRILRHLDATAMCHYTYDEANGTIRTDYEYWTPQATDGERQSVLGEAWPLTDYPHVATALRTGIPQILRRNDLDLAPAERDMLDHWDGQTVIAVPMIAHNRVLGYFEIWDSQVEREYDEADLRLLLAFATQTALAIEHARLLETLEQRVAERTQALKENEERTHLIIDTALDAVITIDAEGLITNWNTQAESIFGWSHQEIVGRPLSATIIPSQYRAAHQRGLKHFLATGEGPMLNQLTKITALHRDGHEFPIELAISPLRLGETFAFSAFVRDITQRKQEEAALALAHDQALEASRLKTELLAKVSHELRTPLGVILGYTEMLEVDVYGPLSDKKLQMTAKIIDSTQYLTGLVNELLDQAQLEAGRLKLNIHPFTPADLVDATLVKMSVLAQAKELSLTSDIAADVPATLRGDAARLQQILVNLISNAIKFTPAGAVRLRLYCPDADHWALQVFDTGFGIPGEAQTYIFEPFRQVDGSVTRAHAGSGLGLSIVKQLTTLMGGEITLESEVGRGSTFTVSLPLQPIQEKTA